jgi:hypothetical protein
MTGKARDEVLQVTKNTNKSETIGEGEECGGTAGVDLLAFIYVGTGTE